MPKLNPTKKHSVLTKITPKDLDQEQAEISEIFYQFKDCFIPAGMVIEIQKYVGHGIKPDPFLTAIICNDLINACFYADDASRHNIPAYVAYFYWETPSPCWGSKEQMDRWIESKSCQRKENENG